MNSSVMDVVGYEFIFDISVDDDFFELVGNS